MPAGAGDFLQGPNFKGKDICLGIAMPVNVDSDHAALFTPTIKMETQLDQPKATYLIDVPKMGTMAISEQLVSDGNTCARLPLDRFAWHDLGDGSQASAKFCLTTQDGIHKIYVQGTVRAQDRALSDLETVVAGISACRMRLSPKSYNLDDQYTSGDTLELGPYIPAFNAK